MGLCSFQVASASPTMGFTPSPHPPLLPYSLSWQNIFILCRGNPVAFSGQYHTDRNVLAHRAFH